LEYFENNFFADPAQRHGSTPKGTPEILAGIGVDYGKKVFFPAYKSSNISETRQDRPKVTNEVQWVLVPIDQTS